MKKSKFLKKSLAMLLAVMLVVAMIPLSAAAEAADPTVYVENQLASLSGTTYKVTAPSGVDVKASTSLGLSRKMWNWSPSIRTGMRLV